MLKVYQIETPSTGQFEMVIHGMRNAFKSWYKNDSTYCYGDVIGGFYQYGLCDDCPYYEKTNINPDDENDYDENCHYNMGVGIPTYVLGKNDKKLLFALTKLGASDRKALRQLPVIIDIEAPEYFWRQLDQYKINTVTNSTSQMHTLLSRSFDESDFSFDNFSKSLTGKAEIKRTVDLLNRLRDAYIDEKDKDEKERLWFSILEIIPQSFNYLRTWSGNYEVLLNIIQQRRNHTLPEWKQFIEEILKEVPYLKELDEVINGD